MKRGGPRKICGGNSVSWGSSGEEGMAHWVLQWESLLLRPVEFTGQRWYTAAVYQKAPERGQSLLYNVRRY